MAILVAVAGAALGSATGIGGSLGWTIGAFIGQMLFPNNQRIEGPRLGDLTVTSSAYGSNIPIGWGTVRISGNIIWSSGIKEKRKKKKTGGKGGPSTTMISYTYSADFALALCEGPIDDVLRIWADGKLIYDKRGTELSTRKKGLVFTLYKGTETQMPDPIIALDKGDENTPAHRGLAYIVFDNLALADFGNRIPNITVEITFNKAVSRVFTPGVWWTGGASSTFQTDKIAVDFDRGFVFVRTISPSAGFRRFNLQNLVEERQIFANQMMPSPGLGETIRTSYAFGIAPDGALIAVTDDGTIGANYAPISRFDPNTFRETARFGFNAVLGYPKTGPLTFEAATKFGFCSVYTLYSRLDYLVVGTIFGAIGVLLLPSLNFLWSTETFSAEWNNGVGYPGSVRGIVRGESRFGDGDTWVLGYDAPTVTLYKLHLLASAEYESGPPQRATGVHFTPEFTMAQTDIWDLATSVVQMGNLVYDQTDNSCIFFAEVASSVLGNKVFAMKVRNGELVWKTEVLRFPSDDDQYGSSGFYSNSRVKGGSLGWIRNNRPYLIDTASGEMIESGESPNYSSPSDSLSVGIYDSDTDSFIGTNGTTIIGRWFFRRAAGEGANVADVVEDLCVRVGLQPTDIDVSDLSDDIVPGYIIGSRSSARQAIEPLALAYFFDGTESDYVLKFVQRGQAPVRTLTQAGLALIDNQTGEPIKETRQQEVEIPERVSVLYMDKENDYQQGTQSAKRLRNPVPSMFSRNNLQVPFPAVFDKDFAKQLSEKLLYTSWIERGTYEIIAPWTHLDLDPTDVVNIVLNDGTTFRARLSMIEISTDLMLPMTGISERAVQYVSTVEGYAGTGPLRRALAGPVPSKLLLMDTPLLRDSDEPAGRAFNPMYYFMGGYSDDGWRSAVLMKSDDGAAYGQVGQSNSPMTWGTVVNVLADPPFSNPFAPDETSTITISLNTNHDLIESCTYLEMMNGANAAAIIKTNGEIEVIQWRDATVNANGTITLSFLLRGRRGTDTMCFSHTSGEIFVLLDPEDGDVFALNNGEVGQTRFYKAVSAGLFLEDAETVVVSSEGRALKPYAPVHVSAAPGTSDSVDITWVRRTRVGGALANGTGLVPLSEDTEAYEIDILSGPGGSVVRTVTGLTSPAWNYSSADQTTDGFTAPVSSVTLRVYQISAQIGRGFTREVTKNVE